MKKSFYFLITLFFVFEISAQPEEHWPHYDSCQLMPQPFVVQASEKSLEEKTEAEFCFSCDIESSFTSLRGLIQTTIISENEKAFEQKLKARVIGQIESKLFEIRLLKTCANPLKNKKWLTKIYEKESWAEIQSSCYKAIQSIKSEVNKRYPELRVSLALSSPSIPSDRVLFDRGTWMNNSPSHLISDFVDLPKLTKEEQEKAEKTYISELAKTPLEFLSSAEFTKKLSESEGFLYRYSPDDKYLSSKDKGLLKQTEKTLRETSRDRYFELINESLVLAYLKNSKPNNKELAQAYSLMESSLKKFLEEEIKGSKNNIDILISYESLVEELLEEDKGTAHSSQYCLVAESLRIKAQEVKSRKENIKTGIGLLSVVPCFFGSAVALSVCIGGAGVTSYVDLKEAKKQAKFSLNRRLTGPQFEKISKLSQTQKELRLAKTFFSLSFLEAFTIGKTIRAVKQGHGHAKNRLKETEKQEPLQLTNKEPKTK